MAHLGCPSISHDGGWPNNPPPVILYGEKQLHSPGPVRKKVDSPTGDSWNLPLHAPPWLHGFLLLLRRLNDLHWQPGVLRSLCLYPPEILQGKNRGGGVLS